MLLVAITLGLILIGLASFVYGAIGISKYAFRVGTGHGIAVLLFPPYTFYFAFFKLDEDDKDLPVASWTFGIVVTLLLTFLFSPQLSLVVQGRLDEINSQGVGEAATEAYGDKEKDSEDESEGDEENDETSESSGDAENASDDTESSDDSAPDAGSGSSDGSNGSADGG